MQEQSTDLRKCEISEGQLVLLVNGSLRPFCERHDSCEPVVTLTKFRKFLEIGEPDVPYFLGKDTYFIEPPKALVPGRREYPMIQKADSEVELYVRAERIYIGPEAVAYGLDNDSLVKAWLDPLGTRAKRREFKLTPVAETFIRNLEG